MLDIPIATLVGWNQVISHLPLPLNLLKRKIHTLDASSKRKKKSWSCWTDHWPLLDILILWNVEPVGIGRVYVCPWLMVLKIKETVLTSHFFWLILSLFFRKIWEDWDFFRYCKLNLFWYSLARIAKFSIIQSYKKNPSFDPWWKVFKIRQTNFNP
jgi:hypothetical protein